MGLLKTKKRNNREIVKRALMIGINYIGTSLQLSGCINDVENLKQFMEYNKYFNQDEMLAMTDYHQGTEYYPTKANIINQLNKLVDFANENKDNDVRLFVSYSGHGSAVPDTSGDELDQMDEVLCPVDYNRSGYIVDDYIYSNFVIKMPSNVKLVMLIDACHSGSMCDLRYRYLTSRKINKKISETMCQVVMVSGCMDNQSSADAYLPDKTTAKNEFQGAMTASFIYNYKDEISYNNLIRGMRKWLRDKNYLQVPQLSSGRAINLKTRFLLGTFDN